jgi:hypothetical protein
MRDVSHPPPLSLAALRSTRLTRERSNQVRACSLSRICLVSRALSLALLLMLTLRGTLSALTWWGWGQLLAGGAPAAGPSRPSRRRTSSASTGRSSLPGPRMLREQRLKSRDIQTLSTPTRPPHAAARSQTLRCRCAAGARSGVDCVVRRAGAAHGGSGGY